MAARFLSFARAGTEPGPRGRQSWSCGLNSPDPIQLVLFRLFPLERSILSGDNQLIFAESLENESVVQTSKRMLACKPFLEDPIPQSIATLAHPSVSPLLTRTAADPFRGCPPRPLAGSFVRPLLIGSIGSRNRRLYPDAGYRLAAPWFPPA